MDSLASANLSSVVARKNNFYITNGSSIFGAYKLAGVDPSSLDATQSRMYTQLLRSVMLHSPTNMTLTQYYIHTKSKSITIQSRDNERSNVVSKRREAFLNTERNLYDSHIYNLVELPFARNLSSFSSIHFLQHLLMAPLSRESRSYIKARLKNKSSILAYESDLNDAYENVGTEIENHLLRLSTTSLDNQMLDGDRTWSLLKALSNLNFDDLNTACVSSSNQLNSRIFEGDIKPVSIDGVEFLKISGSKTRYARIASIKGLMDAYVQEAFFAHGNSPIALTQGEFVIMTRFRGYNRAKQEKYFKSLSDEVDRNQFKLGEVLTGDKKSEVEQKILMNESDKAILKEIERGKSLNESFGDFESQVVVFGDSPSEINKTCKVLRSKLNQQGADIVWESAGLFCAYETFLPGSQFVSKRAMQLNISKAAALALYYKSNMGLETWESDTRAGKINEEAFYVFESDDGVPFYYTPFIGGKCMVIGIGPIRSGKTFLKNTVATHVTKFGGLYRAIDVDPGSECVAQFFREDGSIFRIDEHSRNGFNPFQGTSGVDDHAFIIHFNQQLQLMVSENTSETQRSFTSHEDDLIQKAILSVLEQPPERRSFRSFLDHCNEGICKKLSNYYGKGMYARIYDNDEDSLGDLHKLISVFNLMGIKKSRVELMLAMSEIVYRITRVYENIEWRDVLKILDIDEGHAFLKIPGMAEWLIQCVRQWGKLTAGVSVWTQSPNELELLDDWPALRSAASTFWFMADSEMDREVYRRTFQLKEGHLDAIQNLIPKRQAFVYQPEAKIAKVINLHVEPAQKVINTSSGGEAMVYQKNYKKANGNVDKAIELTINELGF